MGLFCAIAGILALSGNAFAQAPSTKGATSQTKTTSSATPAPTTQQIADAKAKGLVWVNTSTKVYHKEGQYYGKTKHGKFMTEADAQKAGYREAKPSAKSKKAAKKT